VEAREKSDQQHLDSRKIREMRTVKSPWSQGVHKQKLNQWSWVEGDDRNLISMDWRQIVKKVKLIVCS
jgi:hypothetical protein